MYISNSSCLIFLKSKFNNLDLTILLLFLSYVTTSPNSEAKTRVVYPCDVPSSKTFIFLQSKLSERKLYKSFFIFLEVVLLSSSLLGDDSMILSIDLSV